MTAPVSSGADGAAVGGMQAVALPRRWRAAVVALQALSYFSMFAMAAAILTSDDPPNALRQIRTFAALVLAPQAAAWCILRAFAARLESADGILSLQQRGQRVEIRAASVALVRPWRLPLPSPGVSLVLESGARAPVEIGLADPASLVGTLISVGAPATVRDALSMRAIVYAGARLASPRGLLDHPFVKFVLFALVPTIPAFRMHQYIAFGGAFGEYLTFGLRAYVIAFAIWWASWIIGLVLFAAAVRAAIEALTGLVVVLRPAAAGPARSLLESAGRLLFYLGIPGLLLLRMLQ